MNDNKSRMREKFLLVVFVILSALLIAACGGGASDSSTGNNNTDTGSESTTNDSAELPTALPEDSQLNVPSANKIYEAGLTSTDGELLYTTFCAKCHGLKGVGDGPSAGSLHIEGNMALTAVTDKSDDELLETITIGKGVDMPPWGLLLTLEQRKAVLAYVRTLAQQD